MRLVWGLFLVAGGVLGLACSMVTSLDGLTDGPAGDAGGAESDAGTPPFDSSLPPADGPGAPMDSASTPDVAPSDDGPGTLDGSPGTGTLDGPAPEDASPAMDASPPTDASPAMDSPPEAPPPEDTGTGGPPETGPDVQTAFCATRSPPPLFCADFDEGSYTPGWSFFHATKGSLALDGTEYRSSPAAMIVQSNIASSGAVDVTAYRSFSLTGPTTFRGTLDFDVRVDTADGAGGVAVLAQIELIDGAGAGNYFVQLVALPGAGGTLGCNVNEVFFTSVKSNPPVQHSLSGSIPLGTWRHVTFAVTAPFAGGTGQFTMSFDGVQVGLGVISVPVTQFTQTVGVGLPYVLTPSNGWTAVFDNVIFDGSGS
jgi:hypothetical protein